MRAVRVEKGSENIVVDEIDIPGLQAHEVLVKVHSVGLTPGVFQYVRRGLVREGPFTPAHEAAGIVSAVGDNVVAIVPGQRVRINPNICCHHCRYCQYGRENACESLGIIGFSSFGSSINPLSEQYRNGALADYIKVPHEQVEALPTNVSFAMGAKLYELANAHCILRQAMLLPRSTVVITAPTGSMGACCVILAKTFDIEKVILLGRSRQRCLAMGELAEVECVSIGLDDLPADWEATNVLQERLRLIAPSGIDAIIDFLPSGNGVYQVMQTLRPYGSLVHMSNNASLAPVPLYAMMSNCWHIVGTKTHCMGDMDAVRSLAMERKIRTHGFSTHSYKLDQIVDAVATMTERKELAWNIMIEI